MAAPDKDTSALFLSGSIVLIAALGGYLWYQAPLKSARPSNPGLERHEAVVAQRALARLWQDPLAAVDEHRRISPTRTDAADRRGWLALAEEIVDHLHPESTTPDTAVLLVMTDGSPYVEGTEQRIRDRYAVGSALSVACYVPEDGTHLEYVLLGADPPIPLPFEWYGPRALRDCAPEASTATLYERILVLWLSDEVIGDGTPLKVLSSLTTSLHTLVGERYRARHPSATAIPPIAFNLIGPSSSAVLREMVAEADSAQSPLPWPSPAANDGQGHLSVYSPQATVSSDVIAHSLLGLRAGAVLDNADEWVRTTLSRVGVSLSYRIPSDYELSQALLHELRTRGVQDQSHIALLAEWDSYYGRTLPSEFVAAACVRAQASQPEGPCASHGQALEALANPAAQQRIIPWIRHYSYLRGLDGELPGGEAGSKSGKSKPLLGRSGDRSVDDLERPEGEGQLDYVRRLADRLEADSENRDFRAIGILGSDVYDKLLILQGLRKRFPHTLFFTTDLDARLLHPSQYDWTHNLIIVSHFGLQVHPSLQQTIPPFRSNYQSATFVAVLQAIGHVHRTGPQEAYAIRGDSSVRFAPTTWPLAYEVGRTTADLLPTSLPAGATPISASTAVSLESMNSPVSASAEAFTVRHHQVRFLLIGLGVLCAIYLAIPVVRSVPEEMLSAATGQFMVHTTVALALMLGLAIALFQWLGSQPDAEPFYWMEGISLWPSALIRLTVALLCIGFLRLAHGILTRNAERLAAEYHLRDAQADAVGAPVLAGWARLLSPTAWSIDFTRNAESPVALWQEHEGFVRSTWRRVVPQAVMLGVLGVVLLYAFDQPHAPVRGLAALVAHMLSWVVSSALTGLLIFYVVDVIRVCTGFIHQFALEPTRWPEAVVQPLSERRKLPPDLVSEWLDIRFIAERTKVVASLIHYPIIVLFLMILARHRVFDDWSYPPGLLLIYGVSAGYILICAVLLSVAAEKARRTGISRLRGHLYELRGRAQEPGQADRCAHQLAQIDLMLQDIQATQEGAFAHWTQHPVFQAILLPSGGFSLLALLDYFLTQ